MLAYLVRRLIMSIIVVFGVSIGIFIRGRDMGSVVADLRAAVEAQVPLPEGCRYAWSGEFENQQRAMKRLAIVVPLSVPGLISIVMRSPTFLVEASSTSSSCGSLRDSMISPMPLMSFPLSTP